jgi:hypothetical protein
MKKFILTMLTALGMLLFMTANSNAGVHFGIFVGGPGYYCPPPYYGYGCYGPSYGYGWGPHYYHHWYHHHWH